jgi:uncharacterized membrane protein
MSSKKKNRKQTAIASNQELRARKKAEVMGNQTQPRAKWLPLAAAALLVAVAAGGYFVFNSRATSSAAAPTASQPAAAPDGQVAYPVAMFADGQARYFSFQDGNLTIRYFVIKSADGVIRAAFDACDVCWPAGKGYYQDGDDMVCRNCGRRFASNLVNEVQGGCNPAPLTRRIENDLLVIHPDAIRQGAGYFKLGGKA